MRFPCTSLRGIAALLVVFYHYRGGLPSDFNPDRFTEFFATSDSFVDFFFLLSGFVISYVYTQSALDGRVDWRSYFRSRFARIYPLHVLTIIWMCMLFLYRTDTTTLAFPDQLGSNLLLVHAWGIQDHFALNFPSWSISGEMAAYLVYPFLVLFLFRTPKICWIWLVVVISFVIISVHEYLVDNEMVRWERIGLMRAIPAFILGTSIFWFRGISKSIPDKFLTAIQFALAFALFSLLHFGADLVFLTPLFAALILVTWEDRGSVARFLSFAPLYKLGLLSYTIYLTHVPVRATGYIVWPKIAGWLPDPWNKVFFVVACTCTTISISWVTYRYFEIPARDFLRRKGNFLRA